MPSYVFKTGMTIVTMFIYYRPGAFFSLIASMPTKIAESLACGTPIICNNFNNDIKDMIEINNIGILHDFSQNLSQENYDEIIKIIQDDASPSRCCKFSKENFSLELGVSQYVDIYNSLL